MSSFLICCGCINNVDTTHVLSISKVIENRGPDFSGFCELSTPTHKSVVVHHRLAIIDPLSGTQPLSCSDGNIILASTGDITNHQKLKQKNDTYTYSTNTDNEIILKAYAAHKNPKSPQWIKSLQGSFAFAIAERRMDDITILAYRDQIGLNSLYYAYDEDDNIWLSTSIDALLESRCLHKSIREINPGFSFLFSFSPNSAAELKVQCINKLWSHKQLSNPNKLRIELEKSVEDQMMADVPYGVFLDGGIGSAIIASIVSRKSQYRTRADDGWGKTNPAWFPTVHTFSIGTRKTNLHMQRARKVSEFLKTIHHEIIINDSQKYIKVVRDVIKTIESYDVTSVRKAVVIWLLCKMVKTTGIKVLLSGTGNDEIFGGYEYFQNKTKSEFQKGSTLEVEKCRFLFAGTETKVMAAHGIKCRLPFLSLKFVDFVSGLDANLKTNRIVPSKYILRNAFKDSVPACVINENSSFSCEWTKDFDDESKRYKLLFEDIFGSDISDDLFCERSKKDQQLLV